MGSSKSTQIDGQSLAAIDLGSNSYHLVVARYEHGELRVIDRVRETVRMAMGLNENGTLTPEKHRQALTCLAKFGQRLRDLPSEQVRAVATNSVRRLRNPRAFLLTAETALGHPIEVVSGREEARLIYLGVAHGLPRSKNKRLVVDVGGGSTEFIIGQGFEAKETESLQMGCVASTLRFFEDGKINRKRWQRAQTEIEVELQQFTAHYKSIGWDESIGSSGTARVLGHMCAAMNTGDQTITTQGLDTIRERLIDIGDIEKINLPGLPEDRRSIIAGGVVIFETLFQALGIKQMRVCDTAMREGLLYDMLGRAEHRDPREASIQGLMRRYGVDVAQAQRVERSAQQLFDQTAESWNLTEVHRDWLTWCARIHEIGLAIAHSQHHLHGAYLVANSDLFGFSHQEQQTLAFIVEAHRRTINTNRLNTLPERLAKPATYLVALLRIAALLNRPRTTDKLPALLAKAQERSLKLILPKTWLDRHPLSRTDLDQERKHLNALAIKLQIVAE
jgi:exopolyphosphatase/guanosine-5'-triphosphate,3'-diphosphate pyrophosphatase